MLAQARIRALLDTVGNGEVLLPLSTDYYTSIRLRLPACFRLPGIYADPASPSAVRMNAKPPQGYSLLTLGFLSATIFTFVWFQYNASIPTEWFFSYGSLAEHDNAMTHGNSSGEPALEPIELFRQYKVLPPMASLRNSSGQFDFIQRKEAFGLYYVGHAFPG
ncbi:uncharacterized protein PSANT_06604 [Moesziomyces antarcticus]|uniref:Uncharacterized protein n=1 Tax=Pseudozyma antarctica TaxID=84753 RepID=A0A5C3FX18_PSEA2|nr:uncharacterized protein PSANT_06604 [Moesziomyces antarcticus]